MALSANTPSLFLSDPRPRSPNSHRWVSERCPPAPPSTPRLLKTQWKWFPNLGWCQAQRGKPCDTGGGTHSRYATEETKWELFFFVWGVDIVAAQNVLVEVLVHHSGVIADPQLPQPRSPQQQVLIVDEGVGAAAQALVVVPFGPIQTVQ